MRQCCVCTTRGATSNRPQVNGLVERVNGRIISRLMTLLTMPSLGHSWVTQLLLAQWSINSCAGAAGYSGNEGLFGRHLSHLDGRLSL